MTPRPVYMVKTVLKLTCGISALVLAAIFFSNLRITEQDNDDTGEYSYEIYKHRRRAGLEARHEVPLNNLRRTDDSKSRDLFWARLVKRFWVLTKNLSAVEDPSDLLDYFIRDPYYNLWGSSQQYRNIKPTAFIEEDRILPQLILALEGPSHEFMKNSKMKKIYLQDSFKWWNYDGEFAKECPGLRTKCEFVDTTTERVDAAITVRDAFHSAQTDLPKSASRLIFILESPLVSSIKLNRPNDLLTSYWTHSDVVTPYGKWVYYDPDVRRIPQAVNYAKGKTKMAAIFMSNCGSRNHRLGYVKELQKYIKVDVFGMCGTETCLRKNNDECFERLKKDYKFYLAFENTNCRDYITEKFFLNAFSNDVIPVVMGGHPKDYAISAPENSFIHIEHFKSPQQLAKHLLMLAFNETEYLKYFEWKGTGEFISTKYFCRVCAMMHYADLVPPPKRLKPFNWDGSNGKLCSHSRSFYWERISSS